MRTPSEAARGDAAVDSMNGDGDSEGDFESGDFQITCPVVVFSILNSPP